MKIKNNQKGIMLIEMMIGVVLAMLSVLAIYSLYSNFESQKRTTVNTGSAIQNASIGIFEIEHDAQTAGFGINNINIIGCNVSTWDETTNSNFDFILAPANITFGASPQIPDSVSLTFGNSDTAFNSLKVTANQAAPTDPYKVDNRYGIRTGDILIVGEPGKNCSLIQASSLPNNAGYTDNVTHVSGTFIDPDSGAVTATQFNKPGGLGVTYSIAARATNMGDTPVIGNYSIANNQLNFKNVLGNNNPITPVADQIVHMKLTYGKDTNADGAVDLWDRVPPTTPAQWAQIISLRVAIIARSGQKERPNVTTGVCNTTTNSVFTWNSGVTGAASTMDISNIPDWQCYRYRIMHTTVPLRNMIWNGTS